MDSSLSPQQRAEVEQQLRRTDLTRRVRERLEMVKAAALGDDVGRIARWSGRSVATVEHWLARFAAGGVQGLADAPRAGRPVQADAAYLAALETALDTPPHALGLAFDVWTSTRLSAYLEQQTGVPISPGWLRTLLAQHGWVGGRPKPPPTHLQQPAAVAASRAELAAVGKKVRAAPERSELHFQDETHLETNPYLCRAWHRRGKQATLPAAGTNR